MRLSTSGAMPSTTLREEEGRAPAAGGAEGAVHRGAHGLPRGAPQERARRGPGQVPGRPRHELDRPRQRARGRRLHPPRAADRHRRERRRASPSTRACSRSSRRSAGTARRSTSSASYAIKRRQPLTVDVVKRIYCVLHPEEGDVKTVKYRKDIPQHRLYFHEYAPPDKIAYKLRQIVDWVNDPETRRTRTPVRLAARAHYDLLRVFPFPTDSGKVARLRHEPAAAPQRIPAGHHPLDRAAALLRGPQGLERDDARASCRTPSRTASPRIEKLLDLYEPKPSAEPLELGRSASFTNRRAAGKPFHAEMLAKRVIPCLDVQGGRVVKGVRFVGLRDAGDPVEQARALRRGGRRRDRAARHHAPRTRGAARCSTSWRARPTRVFVPLTVGGGVRAEDDVRALLAAGADKVSINTAAVDDARARAALQRRVGLAGHRRRHRREAEAGRRRLGGLRPRRPHGHRARRRALGRGGRCASARARSCSRAWTATGPSPATTSR